MLCNMYVDAIVEQASFLDVRKKNSRRKKLKTQETNSKLKLKTPKVGIFLLKKRFLYFLMTYSPVKIIGFANANVCCNNKLGYSLSLQSTM